MKRLTICVYLIAAILPKCGYSQLQIEAKIAEAFDQFRTENYQEKVYVHNDRPSYLTGETMWFKIYLVDGSFHKPGNISKVAYLEILDMNNQPVLQTKVEMSDGSGAGSLYLPVSILTGTYTLRAYTNWMKNYSPEFYFHKEIVIINSFRAQEFQTASQSGDFEASFFPEGGNLVSGINSKVGFQVVDESGTGIDCHGIIVDQNQDTVVSFTPYRFGIGNFHLTPRSNSKYFAIIKDKKGKQKKFEIPEVHESGFVMELSVQSDNLNLRVQSNDDRADSESIYLFIHSRNRIVKATMLRLRNGNIEIVISPDLLPEGISHFTIFDSKYSPVCERLYFKRPADQVSVSVKTNQTSYLMRNSVKLNVNIQSNKKHFPATLSMAVFKKDSLPASGTTIENYMLLTSDLKGTVESPEFYFGKTPESRIASDNLMLTHGWRRFRWNEVLVDSVKRRSIEFVPEFNGHIIRGLIIGKDDAPVFGSLAFLSSPAKIIKTYPARSREDGKVYFEMQRFYGKSKIVAQIDPREDSTSTLSILSPFSVEYAARNHNPLVIAKNFEDLLVSRSISMQVDNIYYPLPKYAKVSNVDSTSFYGKADATYLLDDYTRFPVLEEVLREYVPGVFVRKRKDGFHFIVINKEINSTFRSSPLILLDGVPIFDEDEIMSFDPRLIRKLEVVQKKWLLGPSSFFGIVSFSTYNGDLAGFELNPNSISMDYDGLQLLQEFYSPKYENKKQRESRLPDQRTLLFWNPMISTDQDGHTQLEFYTADTTGEFQVVVEGMNSNGDLFTSTSGFFVKESN